ncbi:MAG TPA: GAF domain-containing protein [Kofleriaceae bacterium]|jgi:signal transduction histidine kinase|nr:GAF domain-containing protein [Kofleriaceae bacterium]
MADGPLAAAAVPEELQSLEVALRREQRKLALVQDVSRALSSVGDLDQLLALIMEKVTELMDADRATLFLIDEVDGTLSSKVVQGGDLVEIRLASGEGVAGWVAQTRELVNIPDAYADQRFQPAFDLRSGYRTTTILSVPMTGANGALVGVLQVLNKKSDGAFSRADEELLGALAGPAAIAIENARLYQSLLLQNLELSDARRDLERRQRELNALYEVEKDMSHALDLDDLLSRILAQAIGVLGAGAGSIALVEPDGSLRFRTVQGPAAPRLIERTLPHGTGLIGWSIAHKTPVIVDNPGDDPRHAQEVARESGVTPAHLMVAPLVDGEDVMGGIEIIDQRRQVRDSRSQIRGPWNEVDLRLLVLIAAQAASAIGLARRRSEQSKSDRLASIGRMLAGLLHDLKTPMTIISGYGQLMAAADDAAQREQYVEQIQRQFDLMAGMTREVLAFARGDTDLVVRKVYVNKFGEELSTQLGAATAGRGIDFVLEANYDGIAYFDEQKLLRVFHNLTRNAIEAMPEGGKLRVTIDKQGDQLECTVVDSGPGIPAELRGRLFELFATAKKGGTGLGLAIVKKVVDDHRGTIAVETGPSGTAFVVRLPLQREKDVD